MSAKILPFRPRRPLDPSQPAKMISCPFCTFFSNRDFELERHMRADHARAMALYGYKKQQDQQSS